MSRSSEEEEKRADSVDRQDAKRADSPAASDEERDERNGRGRDHRRSRRSSGSSESRSRSASRSRSRDRGRERRRRSYSRSRSRDRYRDDRYRTGGSRGNDRGGSSYQPPAQSWRAGDWECGACRAHNFASRDRCFQCGDNKPYSSSRGASSYDRGGSSRYSDRDRGYGGGGGGGGGGGQPANFKPGDWMCNSCQTHNFANRAACFRCGGPK